MNKKYPSAAGVILLLLLAGGNFGSGLPPAAGSHQEADKLIALLLDNSFREAGKIADGILLSRPENPEIKALCGLAVLKMGRVIEAEAIFREVISHSPDNPEAHLGLGRIGRIRNDPGAAVRHLRRAVESKAFCEEALRQMWRAGLDRGLVSGLSEIAKLAEERFARDKKPLPGFIINGTAQLRGFTGKRLYHMEGRFERISVPLVKLEDSAIRMISLRLNGKSEYPFDIDSAATDFVTISPLLAQELGLQETGSSSAVGVGSGSASVRFSRLDSVEVGSVTFRNIPVIVSDLFTFRGRKKGLVGTGFLKRFNCTIDVRAGIMNLFPLDRPDLMRANLNPAAVAAEVPLYIFDATTVEASLAGAPKALYILDSAAGTNLVDSAFFMEHLKPAIDPALIVPTNIVGAGGTQRVNRIEGLTVKLGSLVFDKQAAHEFSMGALNSITGRYCAGLLGNPLLWPYRVHLDFRSGKLILEKYPESRYTDPKHAIFEENRKGELTK